MEHLDRIKAMIAWQDLYKTQRNILATYEDEEKKLDKLYIELNHNKKVKDDFLNQKAALEEKISTENAKLEYIINQITSMESERDHLKMARQIKSWEKDMEKHVQDREVIEAQYFYDKSKLGDINQYLEELNEKVTNIQSEISHIEKILNSAKAQTADERQQIETQIKEIASKFDTHFVEYFERLLLKNKGAVMSLIEKDACSECNIQLPSSFCGGQEMQDKEDASLLQCPNCFCYLYDLEIYEY